MAPTRSLVPALFAASLLVGCREPKAPPPPPTPNVGVAVVETANVPVVKSYVGALDGYVNAEIRARVAGVLSTQDYKEGSTVKEGQLLFTIDPREFEAAVSDAKAALQRGNALHTNAQAQLARVKPLAEQQAVSKQDLDTAVANEQQAAAAVTSAKAAVERAELNLSYTRMRAPISGIAGAALVRVGNLVGQGQPTLLTTVSQTNPMRVTFSITEEDYLRLARSPEGTDGGSAFSAAQVRIALADGRDYGQSGKLLFVDRQVDPRTGTLRVDAVFPNSDGLLRPGQTATVKLFIGSIEGAALIPQRAAAEMQGQWHAMVLGEDGAVHARPVELGQQVGPNVVVLKGLQKGERVVADGLQKVRDGQKVNVQQR